MIQNAEYWPSEYSASVSSIVSGGGGAGFDVVQHDAFRTAVRNAVATASAGASANIDMDAIAASLLPGLTQRLERRPLRREPRLGLRRP